MINFEQRQSEIDGWLKDFCENYDFGFPGQRLVFDFESSKLINETYWELVKKIKTKKSNPDSYNNVYKIIAGFQLCIAYHQPLEIDITQKSKETFKGERRINAEFGYIVSINILDLFYPEHAELTFNLLNDPFYLKLIEENLTWIENYEFDEKQNQINFTTFFILSQFWSLLDQYRKKLI